MIFLFCTTEEHKLPETFRSRCQRIEFRPIDCRGHGGAAAGAGGARGRRDRRRGSLRRSPRPRTGGFATRSRCSSSSSRPARRRDATDPIRRADLDLLAGRASARLAGRPAARRSRPGMPRPALDAVDAALAGGCKPGVLVEQWLERLRQDLVEAARADEGSVARCARALDVLLAKRVHLRAGADGALVCQVAAVELARLPDARDLDVLIEALRTARSTRRWRRRMLRHAHAPASRRSGIPRSGIPRSAQCRLRASPALRIRARPGADGAATALRAGAGCGPRCGRRGRRSSRAAAGGDGRLAQALDACGRGRWWTGTSRCMSARGRRARALRARTAGDACCAFRQVDPGRRSGTRRWRARPVRDEERPRTSRGRAAPRAGRSTRGATRAPKQPADVSWTSSERAGGSEARAPRVHPAQPGSARRSSWSACPASVRGAPSGLAHHLLRASPELSESELADAIREARVRIRTCSRCRAPTETEPCAICSATRRGIARSSWSWRRRVTSLPSRRAAGTVDLLRARRASSPLEGVRTEDLDLAALVRRCREPEVREVCHRHESRPRRGRYGARDRARARRRRRDGVATCTWASVRRADRVPECRRARRGVRGTRADSASGDRAVRSSHADRIVPCAMRHSGIGARPVDDGPGAR